jgi:intracellular sulfur oxidation DsrE/DsrF family protein
MSSSRLLAASHFRTTLTAVVTVFAVWLLAAVPVQSADTPTPKILQAAKSSPDAAIKVVYHLSEGVEQATRALGNIRNHLAADPTAHIVVVGHGPGIDFMLEGARDARGNPFDVTIQELSGQGVEFRACNNTLRARKIEAAQLDLGVTVVPAGVAEIARLQAREGYVYIHP